MIIRRHFALLVTCLLCVPAVLLALYYLSPLSKEIYRGTFERNMLPDSFVVRSGEFDLKYSSYYIAGVSSDKIYLANYLAPFHMVVVNKALNDSQHVRIRIKDLAMIENAKKIRIAVDSPFFLVTHGLMPGIFKGRISEWEASRFMPDSAYFSEAVPIGESSFALRSFSTKTKAFELAKEKSDSPFFEFKYGLLQKQIDGIFCVEGSLHTSREIGKLVYLYTYRNQFMVMDTNVNLINRYHTIDTFSHARIKVVDIDGGRSRMVTGMPLVVNAESCVFGSCLFVRSNIMGKNEDEGKFKHGAVIDVYNLPTGEYLTSFYLANHRGNNLSQFKMYGGSLIAIFGNYLVRYELNADNVFALSIDQE